MKSSTNILLIILATMPVIRSARVRSTFPFRSNKSACGVVARARAALGQFASPRVHDMTFDCSYVTRHLTFLHALILEPAHGASTVKASNCWSSMPETDSDT
jgi:hypothetical protein